MTSSGLSSSEAAERLARHGPNVIVPDARSARLRRWLGPLADPMVALLLVAAPTYLLIGETADAIVAFAAIVPIAAVGWSLEARAERTLAQLRRLSAPHARVVRDGAELRIPADDVVVGDLVWVHEGDVVPADARVVELTQLLVDEASLTGESLPVAKALSSSAEHDDEDDESMIWAGTTVLAGRALAEVTATGTETRYGRIGVLVAEVRRHLTPLQRALTRLVRLLAVIAVLFCVAVMVAELARGRGWGAAIIAAVSLAIAAIPEEFALVYGLYLALGAWRLTRDRALVRHLPAVETLGSTTVICVDKTGTLTEGRLSVGASATIDHTPGAERRLWEAAVLACEPDPFDPLDVAIVEAAMVRGIDVDALRRNELVQDWPFDPVTKHLTHLWRMDDGTHRVVAKGAVEGFVHRAASGLPGLDQLQAEHQRLAADGMRVIAVGGGPSEGPSDDDRATDEQPLELLGVIGFADPVRAGVDEALEQCRTAGVRVVMITGDHPATAHAVAEELHLPHTGPDGDRIATGADLDAADVEALAELVAGTNVFARTRPEQKHLLVEGLHHQGEVVAMTGDGVNDAPALRAADIGVAMGDRGTDVARSAATMVLLDDNFATIVTAIRDGRRIYDNLSRAFAYLIAFHPPLLLAALVVPLLGEPLLLLPVHLVLLELVLHPVVSLVFQADPADDDVMARPPRTAGHSLDLAALRHPYAIGTLLAGAVIALYLVALGRWPEEQARAAAFAAILVSQPLLVLSSRSPERPVWRTPLRPTRELVGAMSAIAVVTVAAVYLPVSNDLLSLEPFPAHGWLAVALTACSVLVIEPVKQPRGVQREDR